MLLYLRFADAGCVTAVGVLLSKVSVLSVAARWRHIEGPVVPKLLLERPELTFECSTLLSSLSE